MRAAMSTRTPADRMKLNRTQNQTQRTMMSRMTTLDQGLVTDHELQTDDKQIPGFQLCEFQPPLDLKEQRKSGAPTLLDHVLFRMVRMLHRRSHLPVYHHIRRRWPPIVPQRLESGARVLPAIPRINNTSITSGRILTHGEIRPPGPRLL